MYIADQFPPWYEVRRHMVLLGKDWASTHPDFCRIYLYGA